MKILTLNTKSRFIRAKRALDSSIFTFDLPILIENMKHSHTWVKGELIAMILLNSPEKQIVLTVLHEGTEINSFQSKDSITVQIIEGKIEFHTRKEAVILNIGQLLTLNEKVNYSLITMEETVFLLTIATGFLIKQKTKRPGGYKN